MYMYTFTGNADFIYLFLFLQEIKLRIIHVCLKDVVEHILIPHCGYSHTHLAAKDFSVRPDVTHWSPEMRNILGEDYLHYSQCILFQCSAHTCRE